MVQMRANMLVLSVNKIHPHRSLKRRTKFVQICRKYEYMKVKKWVISGDKIDSVNMGEPEDCSIGEIETERMLGILWEPEKDIFRFKGLDVLVVSDGIEIWMEDYSQSLKDIIDIRKADDRNEEFSKLEMKLYRKMTGKIAWLANSTRPDLCYLAMQMSKKNQ